MLMAMQHCVSPRPMPPPPLAPKPNKDNARLQKILKRIAKQQVAEISVQPEDASEKPHSYPSKPFRASLSPVSEASPDPEQRERRTRSPQSPKSTLPPLRQYLTAVTPMHGISLYPIRKTFYKGKIEILQKAQVSDVRIPAEPHRQGHGQQLQPVVPVKTFFFSTDQPGSKKQSPMLAIPPRFSPSFYTQPGTEIPTANISTVEYIKHKSPGPELHVAKQYKANGSQSTVTTSTGHEFDLNRANAPAYEPLRSKTPTYEPPRVKTPTFEPLRLKTPTYEPLRVMTPTYEPVRVKTPTYEPLRVKTPTYEPSRARTPTYEPPRVKTPTFEPPRVKTPTFEPLRVKTPTFEPLRVKTPTYEPVRVKTPTYEPLRVKTPTYEPSRARTPTYEPPRVKTPTFEPLRVKTPTFEPLRVKTPTYEPVRVKTPTYEPPRVKTPTYEPPRVKTPTYEPSGAKTPTYEPPRVKTPTFEPPRVKTPTFEPPRVKTPTFEPPRVNTPTFEPPRVKIPTFESPRAKTPNVEIPREKPFTQEVPHGSVTKKATSVTAVHDDALTFDAGRANVEIHHTEMTTMEKNKVMTELRPSNSVAKTVNKEEVKSFPKAAPQLKAADRIKPPRGTVSGWSRLKKHMVVEEEPPTFPEPEKEQRESEAQKENHSEAENKNLETQKAKGSRANKMWDAMLFQMFALKEHLTETRKPDQQDPDKSTQTQQKTWFSSRLPLLLFRPRFDARRLKEAAKGPLKRISSTLFESGLHRKAIDVEELKDFNRTARGWQLKAAA
ncbi:adhesive plaque matrix protein isoform X2 [Mobula hypostoma]